MADNNTGAPASTTPVATDTSSTQTNDSSILSSGQTIETNGVTVADIENSDLSASEKKEAKKMLKQLEIKYNGKTEKHDLPFEIPEEHADYMRKQIQMAKMGNVKAQEAADYARDIGSFLEDLRTNPREVLSNPELGVDLKKIAAQILEEELERSQKSPEELEREEYKAKLKRYEEKEEQRAKELENLKKQQLVEKTYQDYDNKMTQALETYDIPKTPIAIYEMAHLMSLEIKRGYEPDMEAIAELVQEKLTGGYSDHLKKLSPEKLRKYLGDDVFENERKQRVAKVKQTPAPVKQSVQDVAKTEKKEDKTAPKKTIRELWGV